MPSKTTPKDFFLQISSIAALYTVTVSLLSLVFGIVDYKFPDALNSYYDTYFSGMRMSLAFLAISFSIYLLVSYFLYKIYLQNPEKKDLWIKKWLSYLTLFLAGVTVAVDLVVLLNYFLGGEITVRFALKVFTVLVVAGIIFWFYIRELKTSGRKFYLAAFAISTALVVITIVAAFSIIGSPFTERLLKMDDRRVSDLNSIQWSLINYWQANGNIPDKIFELSDSITGAIPNDPVSNLPYEYKKLADNVFELCANFDLESPKSRAASTIYPNPSGKNMDNWQHQKGRTCFERTIDQKLYPVRSEKPALQK